MKIQISLLVLMSLTAIQAQAKVKVVYGEDNRKDVIDVTDSALVELSKSTAAMISKTRLHLMDAGVLEIRAKSLTEWGACSSERFAEQPTAANCSGFLVTPNILVTAGHCMTSQEKCNSSNWVFDYKISHTGQSSIEVLESNIYSCKKILSQKLDQVTGADYAVIELDRAVNDRRPLEFRRTGQISKSAELVVIGHPTGLPTKISDQGVVRSVNETYFVTNLDTYGGNSGSAVFNAKTHLVEGILVRGVRDYVQDSVLGCYVTNICAEDGCGGESVTKITSVEIMKLF